MVVAIRTNLGCISKGKGDRLWLILGEDENARYKDDTPNAQA